VSSGIEINLLKTDYGWCNYINQTKQTKKQTKPTNPIANLLENKSENDHEYLLICYHPYTRF